MQNLLEGLYVEEATPVPRFRCSNPIGSRSSDDQGPHPMRGEAAWA
jgi:hypothetical protein